MVTTSDIETCKIFLKIFRRSFVIQHHCAIRSIHHDFFT